MVSNTTFNNISVLSRQFESVLALEKTTNLLQLTKFVYSINNIIFIFIFRDIIYI
jgi:hypothetical protein